MTIQVKSKYVYGKDLIYPVCDNAKLFAQIAGNKTLSEDQLDMIEKLGFDIEFVTGCEK